MTPLKNIKERSAVRAVGLAALVLFAPAISLAQMAAQETAARPQGVNTSPFLGGVPTGTPTAEPVAVSIVDAINRSLEHNLGLLLSENGMGRAAGLQKQAMSGLLPNIRGYVSESRQVVNLAAYGFPLPEGIPPIVGPFNLFDARVSLSQAVLDFHALNDNRAEQHNVAAAEHSYKSARDLVVLVAANAYLQALASSARADAARAQGDTAQALYNQTTNLRQAGIVAGIDVLRAEVQLSTERQRITATRNEFEKAKLQLARVMGLPVGQQFTLVSELPTVPNPTLSFEDALERAYKSRPDYQAALERVQAAESARAAVEGEWLPSIRVNADYGDIGLSVPNSHYTYADCRRGERPDFPGRTRQGAPARGRRRTPQPPRGGRRPRASIYYDLKTAFLDLEASNEQLQVATRAREVATAALAQSRDRLAAGVANNIEVIQAQEAVSVANERYITALYRNGVGKAVLARDLGGAEQAVRQYLGGAR